METWARDVVHGARALRRDPWFTMVALLTLALGIGVNTAMFTVVNGVILRPLPYADPGRLVMLWTDDRRSVLKESPTGLPIIVDWRADSLDFSGIASFRVTAISATAAAADPERTHAIFVAPDLFAVLGIQPAAGRPFTAAENAAG